MELKLCQFKVKLSFSTINNGQVLKVENGKMTGETGSRGVPNMRSKLLGAVIQGKI